MRFVYPEFLWAFAALSVPVVIHLFNFRRYKTLYFSSLKFIKKVDQETRSTKNLKHLLVLAARLLMISSLILAFAQPYIPVKDQLNGGKNVVCIYLDNSFSMTAKGTEGELISEARETARKIIERSPDNVLFMVCSNLLNGIEKRLVSKVEALSYLDKVEPIGLRREIPQVIEWQKVALQQAEKQETRIGTVQHVILSDFQKNSSGLSKLKSDSSAYYYPIVYSPQEFSNLYIDTLWFSNPVRKPGQLSELNFRVVNEGSEDLTNVEVSIRIGDLVKDVFVDIPSNNHTDSRISYTEKKTGQFNGTITVNDKQLFWDDEFYFSYSIDKSCQVLVINEENESHNIKSILDLESYYVTKEKSVNEITLNDFSNVDLVILNGLNDPSSGVVSMLDEFTGGGGSVFLIPGPKPDYVSWNSLSQKLRLPLITGISENGNKIRTITYKDPFFKGMFDKEKADISMNVFKKTFNVNPSNSSSINLIELQSGKPLFVKSSHSGTSYLLCSSLDETFGSFTSNSLFPSIILRAGELSKRQSPLYVTIGEETVYPIYNKSKTERPVQLKGEKSEFIPKNDLRGSVHTISLSGTEAMETLKAGIFEIIDDTRIGFISVNNDRRESKVELFNQNEVSEAFENADIPNVSVKLVAEGQSSVDIDLEKPFEYWRLFVIFALIFLLTEIALLKFWK
ncbi:MAG: hypothetical protein EP305_02185 [Bacteroidetes bacterium]|nr:MAG: hypothetical protein EP305_02185 [Bacteroidota bacterium]